MDEILNLIESVSEDFPYYFCNNHSLTDLSNLKYNFFADNNRSVKCKTIIVCFLSARDGSIDE